MNKDLRKALDLLVNEVSKGKLVLVEVDDCDKAEETKATTKKDTKKEVGKAKSEKPKKEVKKESADDEIDVDSLQDMSANELRELAKKLGVAVRGSKSAIIGRIVEALDQEPQDEEEPVEDEAVEEEAETEDDEVDAEDYVEEALNSLSVEELADLCDECELPTSGKKQALIGRLMKAHNDGDIDLADFFEEDVTDEVTGEDDAEEESDIDVEEVLNGQDLKTLKSLAKTLKVKLVLKDKKPTVITKLMECDGKELVDAMIDAGIITLDEDSEDEVEAPTFEGSKARVKACQEVYDGIMKDLEAGELAEEDIRDFFTERFEGNKSELKRVEKTDWEELAFEYAEIVANLIDDDGEEVDLQEPYMVGETPYCCGVPMKKLDDTTYLCEIDGEEVELED